MKKPIALLLTVLLLLGTLTACGGAAASETPAETEIPGLTENPGQTEAPAPTPDTPDFDSADVHPMLWKVTDPEGHTLYLFGTIHVGDGRSQVALEKVAPTMLSCDALAVEFDVVAYEQDTNAMMTDLSQFVYADGTTIRDHMPEELYDRCAALLTEAGAYFPALDYYNLGMWSQLVSQGAMMTRSSLDPTMAMDSLLINTAYENGIEVISVESPAFQYGLLNSFPDELNLMSIESTLDSLDEYGNSLENLYAVWLSGEYDAIVGVLNEEDGDTSDYTEEQLAMLEDYNKAMLDDRNLGMADAAMEYLASGKTVFLAVGTAHMVEEAGLVQLLTDRGCTVERVDY